MRYELQLCEGFFSNRVHPCFVRILLHFVYRLGLFNNFMHGFNMKSYEYCVHSARHELSIEIFNMFVTITKQLS